MSNEAVTAKENNITGSVLEVREISYVCSLTSLGARKRATRKSFIAGSRRPLRPLGLRVPPAEVQFGENGAYYAHVRG